MNDSDGGRILLVVPAGADDFAASVLEKLDHPVTTCHGPKPGTACPLVHGEGCEWFEEAHGIVFALDLDRPAHRAILRTYERLTEDEHRDVPIRVVIPPGSELPGGVDGEPVWSGEPTVADLDGFAALVEAADRFA